MSQEIKGLERNQFTSSIAWLTHEKLLELVEYDPITGIFIKNNTGKVIGSFRAGYTIVVLGGHHFRAGRLAWFYMMRYWPKEIDHIDLCKSNDCWNNLREANRTQNNCNKKATTRSLTGYKGIQKLRSGRYTAVIQHNLKQQHLGTFDTIEEAITRYNEAAKLLHGEFANS